MFLHISTFQQDHQLGVWLQMPTCEGLLSRVFTYSSKLIFFDVFTEQSTTILCSLGCGYEYDKYNELDQIRLGEIARQFQVGDTVNVTYKEVNGQTNHMTLIRKLHSGNGELPKDIKQKAAASSASHHQRGGTGSKTKETRKPVGKWCKYWVNSKSCPIQNCKQEHPTGDALKTARQEWAADRATRRAAEAKRRAQLTGEDPNQAADGLKRPKRERATMFCDWVLKNFDIPNSTVVPILDIAGGKGDVTEYFTNKGIASLIIDPRQCEHKLPQITKCFDDDFITNPDHSSLVKETPLVLGMHPDQATESIVDFALLHKKPFAIVPCCIFLRELGSHRFDANQKLVTTYEQFVDYLQNKHPKIKRDFLGFRGRNMILSLFNYTDESTVP